MSVLSYIFLLSLLAVLKFPPCNFTKSIKKTNNNRQAVSIISTSQYFPQSCGCASVYTPMQICISRNACAHYIFTRSRLTSFLWLQSWQAKSQHADPASCNSYASVRWLFSKKKKNYRQKLFLNYYYKKYTHISTFLRLLFILGQKWADFACWRTLPLAARERNTSHLRSHFAPAINTEL